MKFLVVSRWGDSLDIANTIKNEGHEVKMFIQDKESSEVGFGFVKKTLNWERQIDWADIIIFDYTGYGKICEELRAKGKIVFGGSVFTDDLELDRNLGQEVLKKHKIKILPSKEFFTFKDAIEYVEKNPDSYVIKPCGETQDYKQLLYVGSDDAGLDVIRMLKAYEKTWGEKFGNFQLQRKVKGVEISVAAFFNGNKFIYPVNVTFEHKKLFPNELGVSTGEMGTTMFCTKDSPLFENTLKKLEGTLAKHNFRGHIDINCIVNGNGIYPLEFTSRFGFPQVLIQRIGILDKFSEVIYKTAAGIDFEFRAKKGFQIGAYIVVPPFPFTDKKSFNLFSKDAPVIFKKPMPDGVHPMHLKKVNHEWLITGGTGIAVLVTGTGITMKETQKMMYNRISNVIVNNGYYRNDIGNRWYEDSDKLWSWGLL